MVKWFDETFYCNPVNEYSLELNTKDIYNVSISSKKNYLGVLQFSDMQIKVWCLIFFLKGIKQWLILYFLQLAESECSFVHREGCEHCVPLCGPWMD